MPSHPSLNKIQPDHLDRHALIYVRQSSLIQVRDNTASTMRQYDLVQRALGLGWPRERIQVIDQDQGHSGSSTIGRDGFQSLVAEVGLKHCGAVLSLEVSRLARSCSDWYHLWRFVLSPIHSSLMKKASMILDTTMIVSYSASKAP
jgi:hypothetical protein